MIISIDASRLATSRSPTGVEVYCREIIKGLLKQSKGLILYTPRIIKDLPRQNQRLLKWPIKKLWSQIRLACRLAIHPPDVFFSPAYVIPFLALANKKTRKVVTIHDIAFRRLPDSYTFLRRWFLNLTTRQAVKYVDTIIVPTGATRDDLIKYFNCPKDKIKVTHFGYNQPKTSSSQNPAPKKQILFIGRLEHKKNITNLIRAFKLFNQKYPDYQLVLAGKPGTGFKKLWFKAPGVKYLGYVSAEQKNEMLNSSSCLALVSRYEGFGFPLLEAFGHSLPVLASAIPALKEIGQSACLYVSPNSVQAIAQKMEIITQDNRLRQILITRGRQRLQDFSWQTCSRETLNLLIY